MSTLSKIRARDIQRTFRKLVSLGASYHFSDGIQRVLSRTVRAASPNARHRIKLRIVPVINSNDYLEVGLHDFFSNWNFFVRSFKFQYFNILYNFKLI